MLIQASMQLAPGIFALFYHYALGKNSSAKASNLCLYFILGTITFMATIWLLIYAFVFTVFYNNVDVCLNFFPWLMAGVFLAESIAGLFFYYRKGKFTTLFIRRSTAKSLSTHADKAKSRSDAFILGFFSGVPELIFTLPLYIVSVTELMKINSPLRSLFIVAYIVISIIPLLTIHTLYRQDYNLAKIEQIRIRFKPVIRVLISISFLILAIATISIGVLNHG